MSKKSIEELEADLKRLKEREVKIKEEMLLQKKAADAKATKERNRKIFRLTEMIIAHCGEELLERQEEFEMFLVEHLNEVKELIRR